MASTVTLAVGGSSITIRAPSRPGGGTITVDQGRIGYSEGGQIKYASLSDTDRTRWSLTWQHLSESDKDSLETFVTATANFAQNLITYTDAYSTAHSNCRIVSPSFSFQEREYNQWAGTITIETDLGV